MVVKYRLYIFVSTKHLKNGKMKNYTVTFGTGEDAVTHVDLLFTSEQEVKDHFKRIGWIVEEITSIEFVEVDMTDPCPELVEQLIRQASIMYPVGSKTTGLAALESTEPEEVLGTPYSDGQNIMVKSSCPITEYLILLCFNQNIESGWAKTSKS